MIKTNKYLCVYFIRATPLQSLQHKVAIKERPHLYLRNGGLASLA